MRSICLAIIVMTSAAGPARAQIKALEGKTIRFWSYDLPEGRTEAVVRLARSDTLFILPLSHDARPLGVATHSISRLEVRVPRERNENIRRQALFGGVSGAVVGALAGYAFKEMGAETTSLVVLIPATALAGVLVGAVTGSFIPSMKWQPVDLPL